MNDDGPDGHETDHILGLDLGQASDPSALTVTRKVTPYTLTKRGNGKRGDSSYAVTWIERFDLGTRTQ